ncbi:hypothetical protein L6Q21_09750 [Sandaracinobacter sp. RS1-74]|uniref:hypothetical protein n=1 Tax=Sandaracinobacteroides sayramensis TaxID=2913411 RepID=UPI001EDABB75|nr:hypothetical protein [Sandaracinobacteroides sayramensis]MCG2841263.1 hypothetical protein [Sandaracinobacteroides sayramensis]
MQIELRNIAFCEALSHDSTAYAAEVWIDGQLAFHTRNHGLGGADIIDRAGRWSEDEVNAWLETNRQPRTVEGVRFDPDLESEIWMLLTRELEYRRLKDLLPSHVVTVEHGRIYHYPLRRHGREKVESAVLAANPDALILRAEDETALRRAAEILVTQL